MKDPILIRYLVSNEQDLLWGITVKNVGHQQIFPGTLYPPHNHPSQYLFSTNKGRVLNEFQLLYITQGKGNFVSTNVKSTEINGGTIFLLFPGEWHSYQPDISTGWDEYWIGFGGKDIEERVNNGFFSVQKPLFNVGIRDDIVQLYKQAITTAIEQRSGFQQVLAGIVSHLIGIAYARDKHSKFEDLRVVNQINQAKIRILENFTDDIDLKALSKEMSMSYSWFRRIYKQYTGLSPYHYIQELRIQKSKELLTDTMLTSQEVAYDVGFENPDYFCTAFKKHTGLSPIKYRELVQGGKSKSLCLSAV